MFAEIAATTVRAHTTIAPPKVLVVVTRGKIDRSPTRCDP
jgi:hypothetical protein